MPDRDPEASQNARLLTALIWAGVGLAPVAALVVLLGGSDNSIRFAVLLIAVCVVLIGAALLVRNDPVLLRMGIEEQVEALREELREEIAASAHATGHRVKALQDEMTRMRAAGSPATALPPAGGRSAVAPPAAGRPEPGHTTGGRAAMAPPAVHGGRPAVATASVAPAAGNTPVGRTAAVAPVTGSASVASASVGSASVGSAAVGAASAGAAGFPRQRGAVPPAGGNHQGEYGSPAAAREAGAYGPGLSGSAWAERSAPAEYGTGVGFPAEPKPARRHAAPDTGTDLARFGVADPQAPNADDYAAQDYDSQGYDAGYGVQGGYDQTGNESWAGPDDYHDGYAEPAAGGFGSKPSAFFAESESEGEISGYPQPTGRSGVYGRGTDQYGPDPMSAQHGWAPRSQEQPGRW